MIDARQRARHAPSLCTALPVRRDETRASLRNRIGFSHGNVARYKNGALMDRRSVNIDARASQALKKKTRLDSLDIARPRLKRFYYYEVVPTNNDHRNTDASNGVQPYCCRTRSLLSLERGHPAQHNARAPRHTDDNNAERPCGEETDGGKETVPTRVADLEGHTSRSRAKTRHQT